MRRVGFLAFLLAGAILAQACGSSDKTSGVTRPPRATNPLATVAVDTSFPNDAAKTATNSIHVWVLVGTNCSDLVGGKTDPYDATLDRKGDGVSLGTGKATVAGVEAGKAVVYVEAVDLAGNVEWAGCKEVSVGTPSTNVSITLGKARVYDCSVPSVKDGAPCDDGKLCTVGDTCKGGQCQAGGPKDCTAVTDGCNVGTCDENKGCVTKVATDGTPCDDNLVCTTGDVCTGGQCGGTARDCSMETDPCRTSVLCDELRGGCVAATINYGATCDDGVFCTDHDTCDSSGKCRGTPRDCGNKGCGTGTCDEQQKTCVISSVVPVGSYCNDGLYCTTNDQCDGLGKCVGTPVTCTSSSTCRTAVCSETTFGCQTTQKLAGAPCDDGKSCTTADRCDSVGTCSGTATPSGTPCDDGSSCTSGDTCDGFGTCYGTDVTTGTPCTAPCITSGTCDFGSCYGSYAAANTPCNDGNACTSGDHCGTSGTCVGTTLATCPAGL